MSQGSVTLDTRDWPQGLVDIASVIGPELTIKLAEKYAGVEKYYVPKLTNSVGLKHPWAAILGDNAWRAMCKAFGGQRINVPRGQKILKKRVIFELSESHPELSHRTIALHAQTSESYVRRVLCQTESSD